MAQHLIAASRGPRSSETGISTQIEPAAGRGGRTCPAPGNRFRRFHDDAGVMDHVKVPLRCPIQCDGQRIDSVTLRRPMKAALQVTLSAIKAPMTRAQTAEFEVRFIALMTGLPIATVEEMDCEDFARVFRECGPLYEPETSSCEEA